MNLKALKAILEEEEKSRREAYKSYCDDIISEWGDNAKLMTFEEWEKEFEECGGWANYFPI